MKAKDHTDTDTHKKTRRKRLVYDTDTNDVDVCGIASPAHLFPSLLVALVWPTGVDPQQPCQHDLPNFGPAEWFHVGT